MRHDWIGFAALAILVLTTPIPAQGPANGGVWPSFRGDHASGIADGQNLPPRWDGGKGTNIRW